MKKIKLVYFDGINFGDCLSPFIISKIVPDKKIVHKNRRIILRKYYIKHLLHNLLHGNFSIIKEILFPFEKNLIAIGSIISYGNKKSDIWGAGFMNRNEEFHGGHIYALRGYYSYNKIKEYGDYDCDTFGDPGILVPLFIQPSNEKIYELGIIPHFKETSVFKELYPNKKIIDLNTSNIEKVVKEITQCQYILSSSLHGIIIAHAYHIPALWIKKGYIDTDGFKFYDYFSSIHINIYDGITEYHDYIKRNTWKQLFEKYKELAYPNADLKIMQEKLIKSFPSKYK